MNLSVGEDIPETETTAATAALPEPPMKDPGDDHRARFDFMVAQLDISTTQREEIKR